MPWVVGLTLSLCAITTLAEKPLVLLSTEKGEITLELFPELAPQSSLGFLKLVEDFHYDGLIFHRVIDGFMIQSGGFTFDMSPRQPDVPDLSLIHI